MSEENERQNKKNAIWGSGDAGGAWKTSGKSTGSFASGMMIGMAIGIMVGLLLGRIG